MLFPTVLDTSTISFCSSYPVTIKGVLNDWVADLPSLDIHALIYFVDANIIHVMTFRQSMPFADVLLR